MGKGLHTIVVARMRAWLAAAALPQDGRLPPERDLATRFDVSRTELRKALAVLEAEGRLRRHVGRGTFLVQLRGPSGWWIDEVAETTTPREAMQARLVIEPELAGLAAINATSTQIAKLRALSRATRSAATWQDYEGADAELHATIAEAAGNRLLANIHQVVNGVRCKVVWGHLNIRPVGPSTDYHSFEEHDLIVEAIATRDRRGATDAMRRHLQATMSTLIDGWGASAPASTPVVASRSTPVHG